MPCTRAFFSIFWQAGSCGARSLRPSPGSAGRSSFSEAPCCCGKQGGAEGSDDTFGGRLYSRRLMCTSCIGCASRPKLALSLPIKGPTYWLADRARWRGTAPFGASINTAISPGSAVLLHHKRIHTSIFGNTGKPRIVVQSRRSHFLQKSLIYAIMYIKYYCI